jgi:hypothetical protein
VQTERILRRAPVLLRCPRAEFSGNMAKCERLPGWAAHCTARGGAKHTTRGEGDIVLSLFASDDDGDALGIDVQAS